MLLLPIFCLFLCVFLLVTRFWFVSCFFRFCKLVISLNQLSFLDFDLKHRTFSQDLWRKSINVRRRKATVRVLSSAASSTVPHHHEYLLQLPRPSLPQETNLREIHLEILYLCSSPPLELMNPKIVRSKEDNADIDLSFVWIWAQK